MNRVKTQKVCIRCGRPEIVDGDDINVPAARFHDGTQDKAADAAESVDGDTN
jgi:hypothetical protein